MIGFALHNATEGFGIVAPLAAEAEEDAAARPSWGFLLMLAAIGGGPTFVGTAVGHAFTSEPLSVIFLTLAAGSIIYVIVQLLAIAGRSTPQGPDLPRRPGRPARRVRHRRDRHRSGRLSTRPFGVCRTRGRARGQPVGSAGEVSRSRDLGGRKGTRTPDILLVRQALYQLGSRRPSAENAHERAERGTD